MRKLTQNQKNTLLCLTNNYTELKEICDKYAVIMARKGYNPKGSVWRNEVSSCLNSLIKRGKVLYKYKGMYSISLNKQTKTKLLFICGDDDYNFITYETQDEYSLKQIIELCENSESKSYSFDTSEGCFDAELHEFGEVDKGFIEFIRSEQDYDDTKHRNWIIIDN